jgi:hypothetical protein
MDHDGFFNRLVVGTKVVVLTLSMAAVTAGSAAVAAADDDKSSLEEVVITGTSSRPDRGHDGGGIATPDFLD